MSVVPAELGKPEVKIKVEEKPPIEKKRGRPPKPIPLTWADFEKDALCKSVNEMIKNALNSTILDERKEKLGDTKVGSALIYALYYYTKFKPDHPLMVLMITAGATGSDVLKCLKSEKVVKREAK